MSSHVQVLEVVDELAKQPVGSPKERLLSLDVFRGFTLLGMVLVNSHPGAIYPSLGHARWNGWGFADLICRFSCSSSVLQSPTHLRTAWRAAKVAKSSSGAFCDAVRCCLPLVFS